MDKKTLGNSIKIKKYDDIFGNDSESNNSTNSENTASDGVVYVSPTVLEDFENHPFKVFGKGISELMDSIREHGVLSPIIVRPSNKGFGMYEIISGHRRKYCALELGIEKIPVIIRNIDDEEAVLFMVDSNIQREYILPSEKAFAYKMRLEAIKRQGDRTDLTSGQVGQKLSGSDLIGRESEESGRQIRRYVRLTELPCGILDAVDSKKIGLNTGVELSFLKDEDKCKVEHVVLEMRKFPSLEQAKKLREMSDGSVGLDVDDIALLLMGKNDGNDKVDFERKEIREFFPEEYTARQIEDAVIDILREWMRDKGKR